MRDTLQSPTHIVLVGPMGAGKSSIGRLLAGRLQRAFVDIDARIEAEAGTTIAKIFSNGGEAEFRSRERRALIQAFSEATRSVIATGGGAILEEGNRSAMREAGIVIYLQVDPTLQLQRLQGDGSRPLLATDDPAQRLAELQAMREPLYREISNVCFDTTHYSPQSAVDTLARLLAPSTECDA